MSGSKSGNDRIRDNGEHSNRVNRLSLSPLIQVIGRKQLILLVRYPINTAATFVSMFVFFALIFFGGRTVAGPAFTDSADGLVVGFFLWTMVTYTFRSVASGVMSEAQWGTLERLYMSPYGFGTVLGVKTLVDVCLGIVWAGAMLIPMMIASGRWLHVDLLTVVPLTILTVAPVVGFGFLIGGLALLYKRIENLFGIATFGFVPLLAIPVDRFELLKLLPLAQGSYLTRTAMTEGVSFWKFPFTDLLILVVVAIGYVVVGIYCFRRAEYRARDKGLLGQY